MYSSTSTTSTAASTPTRRQSHLSLPPLLPDELTPLHSSSSSTTTTRGTGTWSPSALRRKSAFISDLISHHSHSTESHPVAGGSKGIGYDGEFQRELEGEGGNGVRDWYSTYTTIDWMHDAVKDSVRLRRLRRRRGSVAGFVKNLLDALEGWIIVTMVGFVSALVAYLVITSEMLLFDLKSGYCTNSYWQPRRFCCQTVANRSALFIGRAMIEKGHGGEEECAAWRSWSQVYYNLPSSSATSHEPSHWIDYGVFIVIALSFALLASILTVYFSSSASVYSSKDSTSVASHTGFVPEAKDASKEDMMRLPARRVAYFAAGSGIPEIKVILSGFVIRGFLGSWTLAVKSVGLTLSVASGLSLGKEGPFVHIASAVGNILSRFSSKYDRNEAKRREIISAACAAGVAVSFGAPVGGVLFSLEEVSYFFPPKVMTRSFVCALIAAMTLKILNPFGTGKIVLFEVTYDRDWHTLELIGFVGLGAAGGICGALFCKANIYWARNVRNRFLKTHPILEVALVTIATVIISFFNPYSKLGGTELVAALFAECGADSLEGLCIQSPQLVAGLIQTLAFALVTKYFLTVVTFGIKLPAGIFIPTLACGALVGRIAALLVEFWHSRSPELAIFDGCLVDAPFGQACVIPGIWAMIGASAFLAGVTRTTISLAVIIFELTGSVSYSVPVMIAVLTAKTLADAIEPRSIYDLVIELSDLPYLDAKQEVVHESTPTDIMDPNAGVITLHEINTIGTLKLQLAELSSSGGGFPIIALDSAEGGGGKRRMYGYIAIKELEHALYTGGLSDETVCTFKIAEQLAGVTRVTDATTRGTAEATCDLSWLIDTAPLVFNIRSPLELVHQTFVKLGSRYIVFSDEKGYYLGVLEKNRYLAYLRWTEKKHQSTFPSHLRETSNFDEDP